MGGQEPLDGGQRVRLRPDRACHRAAAGAALRADGRRLGANSLRSCCRGRAIHSWLWRSSLREVVPARIYFSYLDAVGANERRVHADADGRARADGLGAGKLSNWPPPHYFSRGRFGALIAADGVLPGLQQRRGDLFSLARMALWMFAERAVFGQSRYQDRADTAMKIMLLWDYYDHYLRYFYDRHPEAAGLLYREQQQQILADHFNWYAYLSLLPARDGARGRYCRRQRAAIADQLGARKRSRPRCWRSAGRRRRRADLPVPPRRAVDGRANHYLGAFLKAVRASCGQIVVWRAVDWTLDTDWARRRLRLLLLRQPGRALSADGERTELVLPCFERADSRAPATQAARYPAELCREHLISCSSSDDWRC